MALTVTHAPGSTTITAHDGATAFDIKDYFPNGVELIGIKFYPSAAGDILVTRDGSATGAIISKFTGEGKDVISQPRRCFPYLKVADQTFNTAANVVIIFEYA